MLLLAVAVYTIFYNQLCNKFSNFTLSLVTKRGRTSAILDLVNFLLEWLFFLIKVAYWSEMVKNVMESDFWSFCQPFCEQK